MTLPPLAHINNLLIVKTSSIGDVLHALPVAQALHDARPQTRIGWVVRARCADVLRGCPFIDKLYVVPDKPSLSDLLALRRELRAARYDAALDLQGLALSGLLTWLSGAPVRVGWDRNREGNALFLTHPIVPGRAADRAHTGHEIDLLLGFAEVLGVEPAYGAFPVQEYLAAEGRPQAREWLQNLPRPRVVLNVGSSRAAKRWPVQNWAAVADGLLELGAGVVFVGSSGDRATVAEVRVQMKVLITSGPGNELPVWGAFGQCALAGERPEEPDPSSVRGTAGIFAPQPGHSLPGHLPGGGGALPGFSPVGASGAGAVLDLSGQTTLRTLASVLAECDLVVSADSGPLHLAAAVGTPSVALFGGTDPRRHGPYGTGHVVLHRPASGTETPSRRPSEAFGAASMARVTPADVLEAVQGQLSALNVYA